MDFDETYIIIYIFKGSLQKLHWIMLFTTKTTGKKINDLSGKVDQRSRRCLLVLKIKFKIKNKNKGLKRKKIQ